MPAKASEGSNARSGTRQIKFGRYRVPLPRSRAARLALGIALLAGGCMFFLPVLGLWMLPLGLIVLSADLPSVRRARRRLEVWWGRRKVQPK